MTAPRRDDPLTFSEELLLLLTHDSENSASIPRDRIDHALAGAVLMDLAYANRIDADPKALFVIDRTPTGNPVLDPVLVKITARQETSDTLAWLKVLAAEDGKRIRDKTMVLLGQRGMLERRDGRFNRAIARWFGVPARWRKGAAGTSGTDGTRRAGRRIGQRVREALLSDGIADPRDVGLIGLVAARDPRGQIVPDEDIHRLRLRVAQLRRLDLIGRELVRVVSDTERGVT